MKRFKNVMSAILAMNLVVAAPGLRSFAAPVTDITSGTPSDAAVSADGEEKIILDNIYINDINVGGMTAAEAEAKFGVDASATSAMGEEGVMG